MDKQPIKEVQDKILETMMFIDKICRDNKIDYYIMGGTALGAVRHGGFIPWDDDLDIFMTPSNYKKFKSIFEKLNSDKFVIQEWNIVDDYLGYSKIRMNGTTFIEEAFKHRKDLHQGIYVDIMMLHKAPENILKQKLIYYASKYVVLVGLSKRNWKPKTKFQKIALETLNILPNKFLANQCYKLIYKYEKLEKDYVYCYFLTKAKFNQGIFNKNMFQNPIDIPFEDTMLMGSADIKKYLKIRYGNYMELPSKEEQDDSVHAEFYDTEVGFEEYL